MWPRSLQHWLDQLRFGPDNEFIGTLMSRLRLVHTKELRELSTLGAGQAGLFFILIMSILIFGKHHGNIRRLMAGEESKIGARSSAESPAR